MPAIWFAWLTCSASHQPHQCCSEHAAARGTRHLQHVCAASLDRLQPPGKGRPEQNLGGGRVGHPLASLHWGPLRGQNVADHTDAVVQLARRLQKKNNSMCCSRSRTSILHTALHQSGAKPSWWLHLGVALLLEQRQGFQRLQQHRWCQQQREAHLLVHLCWKLQE